MIPPDGPTVAPAPGWGARERAAPPAPHDGGKGASARTLAAMTLTDDERQLLRMVAESPKPVAPSGFFHTIHPPTFDAGAPEDDPRREAWTELQLGLYGAMLSLHEQGLLRVVEPANGRRPDLVEATESGRSVLA